MKTFAQSLLSVWRQLGVNQRASLIVAALVVCAGVIAVGVWSRRPDFQLLYSRLGDKDSAAIIGYLEAQNIPHQVTAGGSAVQVPSDQVYKVRMDLAGKGLPNGDGVGFEIFDKGQFGVSDFIQRTNYLRAIQGELGRTISQLQGVHAARVMIVQPENRLLLTDQSVKSTASIFIDLGGGRLEPEQVNAIRHLVANAVQGLQVDDVAVIDNHGHVISEDLKQDPTLGTASSQMRYRAQVEDYLAKKVESMLAQVIGPGNAVVRVSAEIETQATTETQERYDPEGQVVRSQTTTEDVSNSTEGRNSGGVVGVSANVPDKAAAAAPANRVGTSTETNRKNRTITYEINRTLTSVTRNPGAVRSLTAAILIGPRPGGSAGAAPAKRTPEELAALKQLVANALGVHADAAGGLDAVVTIDEMPFVQPAPAQELQELQKSGRWQGWLELASRWVAVAGAALVFVVFLRVLSRQRVEPVPADLLAVPDGRSFARGVPASPEVVAELIRGRPAQAGAALRDWTSSRNGQQN
jgi:flagellar M-ring protein FliF